ncbi:unnamed protein product [Paramecium sonneborni]|uniref:Transmembrane protein n=1 Tax=Paramecium sonneborni TaxID=65129 RepID=A0A8S1PEU0_9CILI|nr:unnamed protein product [Paramecium sonneborni]
MIIYQKHQKRSELNSFIIEIFASYMIPLFQISFLTQFKIKFKEQKRNSNFLSDQKSPIKFKEQFQLIK